MDKLNFCNFVLIVKFVMHEYCCGVFKCIKALKGNRQTEHEMKNCIVLVRDAISSMI